MKKNLISALVIILFTGTLYANNNDVDKEKKAVMQAIKEQTEASGKRDMDRLSSYWVQDESIVRLASGQNNYNFSVGWDDIGNAYKNGIKNNPEPLKFRKEYSNVKIKVYENSAWAVFNESTYDSENELINEQIGTRFLEKDGDNWKIVYMSFLNTTSYED